LVEVFIVKIQLTFFILN